MLNTRTDANRVHSLRGQTQKKHDEDHFWLRDMNTLLVFYGAISTPRPHACSRLWKPAFRSIYTYGVSNMRVHTFTIVLKVSIA